jgi:hypothetical protein
MAQVVVVEVNGGIAEVTEKPAGIHVHILDFDEESPDYLKASLEPADVRIEPDDNAACEHRSDSVHEETPRNGTSYCHECGDVGAADPMDPIVRYYHGDSFDLTQRLDVTVLRWSHKHGRDTTVYATEALAWKAAAEIVRQELEERGDSLTAAQRDQVERALDGEQDEVAARLFHQWIAMDEDDICVETLPVLTGAKGV